MSNVPDDNVTKDNAVKDNLPQDNVTKDNVVPGKEPQKDTDLSNHGNDISQVDRDAPEIIRRGNRNQ